MLSEAGMWGTEVARGAGPVPFLVYEQRQRRVTELLDDAARWADRDHLVQGRRRVTFAAMTASGTPDQVAAKLQEFGRHMDHVIVYPASFGMTEERSRQLTADLLKAAGPG